MLYELVSRCNIMIMYRHVVAINRSVLTDPISLAGGMPGLVLSVTMITQRGQIPKIQRLRRLLGVPTVDHLWRLAYKNEKEEHRIADRCGEGRSAGLKCNLSSTSSKT
jgi:hypothetical protein